MITKGNPLSGITVPVATTSEVVADDGLQLGAIVGLLGIIALIVAAVLYVRSRREPVTEPPPEGTGSEPGAEADDEVVEPAEGTTATASDESMVDESVEAAPPEGESEVEGNAAPGGTASAEPPTEGGSEEPSSPPDR